MKFLHYLAYVLLWVGGINWGLIGFFGYNLVESLGLSSGLVSFVYDIVGISTLYILLTHKKDCLICGDKT